MKIWKLWGIAMLTAIGMGCDAGGIKINTRKCEVGVTDCGQGSVCVPTGEGAEGICERGSVAPCADGGTFCPDVGQICYQNSCKPLASVPCEDGGTQCSVGEVCNTNLKHCEFGTRPGECEGMANGTVCADGNGVCYQNLCRDPNEVPCEEGGTQCSVGEVCNTNLKHCEFGTRPGECEGMANGTVCADGNGVCYQNLCRNPNEVPCEDGGIQCSVGEVCNTNLKHCEFGTRPGECEGMANGTVCADGNGVCYQNLCRNPNEVPCEDGGTQCSVGEVCNTNLKHCEFGTRPGECEGMVNGTVCANGNGVCYQNLCRNPNEVPCEEGGTQCGAGYVCNTNLNYCEFGTTPGECEGMANGTACANGAGVCHQNLCRNPEEVPCEEGGTQCGTGETCLYGGCVALCTDNSDCNGTQVCSPHTNTCVEPCNDNGDCPAGEVCYLRECRNENTVPCENGGTLCPAGEVCNTELERCEFGTRPGECEGMANGTTCANGAGVCYQNLCRNPNEVPCEEGGTWCDTGYVCNTNLDHCELGTTPGECEGVANGTECANGNGVCYQNLCRNPGEVPCEEGGTQCGAGYVCNTNLDHCEVGTTPGECEGVANGTTCANGTGVCYQNLCRNPGEVPCEEGGTQCGAGYVCNTNLDHCEVGTTPGECEGVANGTTCANGAGVCYQNLCRDPNEVPCEEGGTWCDTGYVCNTNLDHCEVGTTPGECEGMANGTTCANGAGVCYQNLCRDPNEVPCEEGGTWCDTGYVCNTNLDHCEVGTTPGECEGVANGTTCANGTGVCYQNLCRDPNEVPCEEGGTQCNAGHICNTDVKHCELGTTPGECEGVANGTECANGAGVCYQNLCRDPNEVPCEEGGTQCNAGHICNTDVKHCEVGTTPGECEGVANGTTCANGTGVCYQNLCRNPEEVPCEEGGTWCDTGYVCNTNLDHCEVGTTPGECEGMANGTTCANGTGVCYQNLCRDPNEVPCEEGGTQCNAGHICNTDVKHCEFGTTPGECEGMENGTRCADEEGVCYQNLCRTPEEVPCEEGGTWCDTGYVCNTNLDHCELGTIPGECEGVANGTECANGNGVCYQNLCRNPNEVPCEEGGTQCGAGYVCNTNLNHCEFGTTPGECEGMANGTACANGAGVCYQNLCRDPNEVPCEEGGTWCDTGYVCNTNLDHCEVGTTPGECEGVANGTTCANGTGVCYQNLCRDPNEVPCEDGGIQCSVGEVCNTNLKHCEFGTRPGECEGMANGTACANGTGVCYQNLCRDPNEVPCEEGGTQCPSGQICYDGNCEVPVMCENNLDCHSGMVCVNGTCMVEDDPAECVPVCLPEEACIEGVCQKIGPADCTQTSCLPGAFCINGICRVPNPGDDNRDMDCDGIADWEENIKVYLSGERTDPLNPDTDGDGILDGIEIGRSFSADPLCADHFPKILPPTHKTDPTRRDTDCDGLSDGEEDANHNGRVDPGETDPNNPDTDGDGLWDGLELGVTAATAADPMNCPNTPYDEDPSTTTDPLNPDTDGDGMPDGIEDENHNGRVDSGETNPNVFNVFDPEVMAACSVNNLVRIDIQRNLVAQMALGLPIGFQNSYVDIQRVNQGVATRGLMGFDSGRNVAFLSWKHMGTVSNIEGLEILAQNQANRIGETSTIDSLTMGRTHSWDVLSAAYNALDVTIQISGSNMSPAGRANDIATRLLGVGSGALLTNNSASGGTQHVRAQYVLRENGEVIVVVAVAIDNDNLSGSPGFFGLNDVAGGTALARYFDQAVVQCEISSAVSGEVDFLFVVDDSSSMSNFQARLGKAGDAMAAALNNSNLDWRVAVVSSDYHHTATSPDTNGNANNRRVIRGFTKSAYEFQAWLTPNNRCRRNGSTGTTCTNSNFATHGCSCVLSRDLACLPDATGVGRNGGCWLDDSGSSTEGMLGAARLALMHMNDADADPRIRLRENSEVIVIILSDTEDQTRTLYHSNSVASNWENIQNFIHFFLGEETTVKTTTSGTGDPITVFPVRPGTAVRVNAVYCPAGRNCGGGNNVPAGSTTRIQNVVEKTGGLLASIQNEAAIANIMRRIVDGAIGRAGIKTQKPLIGASLHVAVQRPSNENSATPLCNGAHVSRSRENGFDYDGIAQTVVFFGNCRPLNQSRVVISYRAWEASDRDRLPCQYDIHFDIGKPNYCRDLRACDIENDACVCPANYGGCPTGTHFVSNVRTCACVPN